MAVANILNKHAAFIFRVEGIVVVVGGGSNGGDGAAAAVCRSWLIVHKPTGYIFCFVRSLQVNAEEVF